MNKLAPESIILQSATRALSPPESSPTDLKTSSPVNRNAASAFLTSVLPILGYALCTSSNTVDFGSRFAPCWSKYAALTFVPTLTELSFSSAIPASIRRKSEVLPQPLSPIIKVRLPLKSRNDASVSSTLSSNFMSIPDTVSTSSPLRSTGLKQKSTSRPLSSGFLSPFVSRSICFSLLSAVLMFFSLFQRRCCSIIPSILCTSRIVLSYSRCSLNRRSSLSCKYRV